MSIIQSKLIKFNKKMVEFDRFLTFSIKFDKFSIEIDRFWLISVRIRIEIVATLDRTGKFGFENVD